MPVPSTFAFLSPEQRLSRISLYPGGSPVFDPYLLLAAPTNDNAITACLWTTDDEDSFRALVFWVSQWTGPTSLVMTTTTPPRSAMHQQLIQRLKTLQSLPSLSGLSLHLVHVTNNQYYPSLYLNLARFFANSPIVMLFPANPSNVLPSSFYKALTPHIRVAARKPLLIASTVTSAFSIPGLTPVILPRNYGLWCTDRAFLASRTSDWDDCLWQLWLEEYGLGHANISIPLDTEDSGSFSNISKTRVRNRLSGKYRAEICELAIRHLSIDAPRISKSGKRRLQWARSFCRQVCNPNDR
ncbi:hypothetical protein C8R44DRAFT_644179 [Mycena epipterygia]|nr:hypothetical protein C8R44DRAFT_644179 [Mycena epipterygia]